MDITALTKRLMRLRVLGCTDQDQGDKFWVQDGDFVFRFTGRNGITEEVLTAIKVMGVPADAEQDRTDNADGSVTLTFRWPSYADEIFLPGGILDQNLDGYEMRVQQLHMARCLQSGIEMGQNVVAEAPTGTGKSFVYGAMALRMGLRVLISTSNKALQAQLYQRDIPFLAGIFNPDAKIVLAQGKGNYLCLNKMYDDESGEVTFQHDELLAWATGPECTGNMEDATFGIDDETRDAVNVDSSCLKKRCPVLHQCFFYREREKREDADVLISNHALLVINELYPMANLLPTMDLIVIDEAHKLTESTRNAIGDEFRFGANRQNLRQVARTFSMDDRDQVAALDAYYSEFRKLVDHRTMDVLPLEEWENDGYESVSEELSAMATFLWPDGAEPTTKEDAKRAAGAKRIRNLRSRLREMAKHREGMIRWLSMDKPGAVNDDTVAQVVPHDVSWLISQIAGFSTDTGGVYVPGPEVCHRCNKTHGKTVHVLVGRGYCADCIAEVDFEDVAEMTPVAEWMRTHAAFDNDHKEDSQRPPVLLCSATLAGPDFSAVMREWGVKYAIELIVDSPFDYANNSAIYIPNGSSPSPADKKRADEYFGWLEQEIRRLVKWAGGGAFVLFTSNYAMDLISKATRQDFEAAGMKTFVQGELPKVEMIRQFTEAGNGVLFGTRSFFEGVDVQGDPLRLVILDKLPFSPLTPLRQAEDDYLRRWAEQNVTKRNGSKLSQSELEFYPFDHITIPRMIVDMKQVHGRGLRTQNDRFVFALLDNRARTKMYGRQKVVPALPKAPDLYMIEQVAHWFEQRGFGAVELESEPGLFF